jgi:nucleoside-triphosphatase
MAVQKNILITGYPGVGKTTLIRRVADALDRYHPIGFFTAEIREGGVRKGFELIDFGGKRFVLSHVNFGGRCRVGKYAVDIDRFERYLTTRNFAGSEGRLVILDEIGKMECFSPVFIDMVEQLMRSDKTVLATISRKGSGAIQRIRERKDAFIAELTTGNRDSLASELIPMIHRSMASD